jgi:hypothetical protein
MNGNEGYWGLHWKSKFPKILFNPLPSTWILHWVVYAHVTKSYKKFADTSMPCTELLFTRVPFRLYFVLTVSNQQMEWLFYPMGPTTLLLPLLLLTPSCRPSPVPPRTPAGRSPLPVLSPAPRPPPLPVIPPAPALSRTSHPGEFHQGGSPQPWPAAWGSQPRPTGASSSRAAAMNDGERPRGATRGALRWRRHEAAHKTSRSATTVHEGVHRPAMGMSRGEVASAGQPVRRWKMSNFLSSGAK